MAGRRLPPAGSPILTMTVPEAVAEVVEKRSRAQSGIAWPRSSWEIRLPHLADRLRSLPDVIDRAEVKRHAGAAARNPVTAEWGFVVAMVWGYGSAGYGPWRVQQMFSSIDDPPRALQRVASTLLEQGALSAYGLLGGAARMFKLGPAFGTKFLYFCEQPPIGHNALILDRLVADWLRAHTSLTVNPGVWNSRVYGRYLDAIHEWAEQLSISPEEVERAIFQSEAASRGGQWA